MIITMNWSTRLCVEWLVYDGYWHHVAYNRSAMNRTDFIFVNRIELASDSWRIAVFETITAALIGPVPQSASFDLLKLSRPVNPGVLGQSHNPNLNFHSLCFFAFSSTQLGLNPNDEHAIFALFQHRYRAWNLLLCTPTWIGGDSSFQIPMCWSNIMMSR
jgi:hypothetical protein